MGTLIGFLMRDRPVLLLLAIGAAVGAVQLAALVDLDFLLGTSPMWASQNRDQASAMSGYYYFMQEPWRFPLLRIEGLNIPKGATLVNTDSIPLLALLAKLVRGVVPAAAHYFGLWLGATMVLQGAAAAALAGTAGARSIAAALAAATIAASLPAYLSRHPHMALSGHFLILSALALYFVYRRADDARAPMAGFIAVHVVAFMVHPYLFAMTIAVGLAALVERVRLGRLAARRALLQSVGFVLLMAALAAVLGHFSTVKATQLGFRHFSMNLLSPVYPWNSALFPWAVPPLDATGGQYEGYNYLGMGLLLLLVVAAVFARGPLVAAVRRHPVLAIVLALLVVYSLSSRIFIGHWEIIHLSSGLWLVADMFRVPGRFFWPVAYAAIAAGVVLVSLRFRRGATLAILVLCVGLQLADTRLIRRWYGSWTRLVHPQALQTAIWRPRIAAARRVFIYPPFLCGGARMGRPYAEIQREAARINRPSNASYAARLSIDCKAERAALARRGRAPQDLYVFLIDPGSGKGRGWWARAGPAFRRGACRRFRWGVYCAGADHPAKDGSR